MTDVLTKIKVREERVIPIGFGKSIEYKFTTNFTSSSELVGGTKKVLVNVRQKGNVSAIKAPIKITLLKPDQTVEEGEGLSEFRAQINTNTLLGSIKFATKPDLPIFDDIDNVNAPVDPTPPVNLTQFEYLIKDNDSNGTWTIQIENKGLQSETFDIEIRHPDLQLQLVESKVPFSLLNRLLKKVNRLFAIQLKIDNNLTLDFSNKAKKMLGLDKIEIELGKLSFVKDLNEPLSGLPLASTTIDFTINNINLQSLEIRVIPSGDDAIALAVDVSFETVGNEINIVGPDVNITKLEVKSDMAFRAPFLSIFYEERNLAGEYIASHFPKVDPEPAILPIIESKKFLIFKTQEGINSGAQTAIKKLLKSSATKNILKSVAEHFTDMILFLASGKDNQVFYDIQSTSLDFTVRHYVMPSAKVRLQHNPNIKNKATNPSNITMTMTENRLNRPTSKRKSLFTRFRLSAGSLFRGFNSIQPANRPSVNAPINPNFKKIEHIVVLTLENRSFDHMLGYLTRKKNRTDVDGLGNAVNHSNPIPGSNFSENVFKLNDGAIIAVDPGHNVDDVKEQIVGGQMTGFVSNYMRKSQIKNDIGSEKLVMGFYDDEILGVYDFLADNYMVCNRWFSSHPGPTYPNRFISLMGSTPSINNFEIGDNKVGAVKGDTIFDVLSKNDVSWNYVESNIAFLRMFDKYRVDEQNIIQRDEWLDKARKGMLPAVSWIDPHIIDLEIEGEADDDHPPANVSKGQLGVKEIYDALRSNDLHWGKTMFIITYDEHGGFYDHVPPHGLNGEVNPVVHKIHKDGADHYGVRVPAFVISPWVKPKSVSNLVFDHTSILKTILLNFLGKNAVDKELLGKRTDAANSLLSVLDARPRSNTPDKVIVNSIPTSTANSLGEVNEREVNSDSFHDNMLLFGFGLKFRKIVSAEIKKRNS